MTNIEKLALDIARSDNPEKVLKALFVVLDMIWGDNSADGERYDMEKALKAIETVVPAMAQKEEEAKCHDEH